MERKEHKKSLKIKALDCVLVAMIGLASVPLFNQVAANRIFNALIFGNHVDCSQGVEPLSKTKPFDAIVIPGAGLNKKNEPNIDQRTRDIAGAVEYIKGKADTVILQDGPLPFGANPDLDRKYFQIYVWLISKYIYGHEINIPTSAIIVDNHDNSINTAGGMDQLKEIGKEHHLRKFLNVDSESHRDRSTEYACSRDLAMSSVSAEEVAASVDPTQKINIKPPFLITLKENIELIAGMFDNGTSTIKLKQISSILRTTGLEFGHYFPILAMIAILTSKNKRIVKK